MPTTPNNLPYPDGNATPDVPYWLQQLAEALDAHVADTGWLDVAFKPGYESFNNTDFPVLVRQVGRVVYLRGLVKNTAGTDLGTAATTMFTIPEGLRPPYITYQRTIGSTAAHAGARLTVLPSGEVSFQGAAAGSTYWGCDATWPLGLI